MARLSAAQYSYVEYRNNVIRLKFLVPSHWEQRDGTNIVSFHEPVNSGEIDSMVSLAVKTFSREVNQETYLAECNTYMQYIAQQFAEDFTYTDFMKAIRWSTGPRCVPLYSRHHERRSCAGDMWPLYPMARYTRSISLRGEPVQRSFMVLTYIRSSFESISVI